MTLFFFAILCFIAVLLGADVLAEFVNLSFFITKVG
jgi:hypothetical protein